MEPIIKQTHALLIRKKKSIAVAESCSGGLLSSLLTQVPGSSQYFILGVTAYSNRMKKNILGIPEKIIAHRGAVSKEVSCLMAKKIRLIAKTDFAIGITGIAGPSGGTKAKPVGTVFIAVEGKNKKLCRKFRFTGTRLAVRKKAALKALELLKQFL